MNSYRIVIGLTNSKDLNLLPLFLNFLQFKEKINNLSVMIFCQNIRLKNLVKNINDPRINDIISDSELHFLAHIKKDNNSLSNDIPIKTLKFLASSDRSISYDYFPLTKAIKKVLTNKDYKNHYHYVAKKFQLTIQKLKDFDPDFLLAFTRDNGPVMYNYLYFASKRINRKIFFQHWLRVEGIITINDTIFEKCKKNEDIYNNIIDLKMAHNKKVFDYRSKYIESNKKVIERYYGETINKNKKLFNNFIKTVFQLWRIKYIILQLNKFYSNKRLRINDRIDSLSIIILNFRKWYFLKKLEPRFHQLNKKQKYIYYPLHAEPEVSTLVIGNKYIDQLSLIKTLGITFKKLGYKVIIKGHPHHYHTLPFYYMQKILSIDNVYLVDHRINGIRLIKNAELIITSTGTSSLEACYMGKKSITLEKTVFSGFINSPVEKLDNLSIDSLKRILDKKDNKEDIKQRGLAWIQTTFNNKNFNLIGNSWESLDIAKNNKKFRESYFQFICDSLKRDFQIGLN